jgi:hypothetical protein
VSDNIGLNLFLLVDIFYTLSVPSKCPNTTRYAWCNTSKNYDTKQQFFCFIRSKQGRERSYHFKFSRVGSTTLSTVYTSFKGKIPIAPHMCHKKSVGLITNFINHYSDIASLTQVSSKHLLLLPGTLHYSDHTKFMEHHGNILFTECCRMS